MSITRGFALALLLTAVGVGCSDKKEGAAGGGGGARAVVASCDQRGMAGVPLKNCIEYTGSAWTAKEIKARCSAEGQTFLEAACPTEGVVLSCRQLGGKPMEAVNRYYDRVERATEVCKSIEGEVL